MNEKCEKCGHPIQIVMSEKMKLERSKELNSYWMLGLRMSVIVNGAAIISILTFLGNLISKNIETAMRIGEKVQLGLAFFIAGVALALLAIGVAFLAEFYFSDISGYAKSTERYGHVSKYLTITFGFLSMIAFVVGAIITTGSFTFN